MTPNSADTYQSAQPEYFDTPEVVQPFTMWVVGTPIPQGSKKAFVRGKRAVIVDDNATVLKPWRKKVTMLAVSEFGDREQFTSPMFAQLDFYMPRPASVKRPRPSVKPDADKLTRAILDAFTDAKVWRDDAQVVSMTVNEWYADDDPAGVRIHIGAVTW